MQYPLVLSLRRLQRRIHRALQEQMFRLGRLQVRARRNWPGFVLWLRSLLIFPLWLSFEAYIAGWTFLERHLDSRASRESLFLQRLAFCLLASLTAGQFVLLMWAQVQPSLWTVALSASHGLAVHFFWERGRKWCLRQAGFWPPRAIDPQNPYAGLDFGS